MTIKIVIKCFKESLNLSQAPFYSLNISFNEGSFPDSGKVANALSIFYKKYDKYQPSNNRPVAIVSCLDKLQERIRFFRICMIILLITNVLKTSQGFLPHHSTAVRLIDIYHNISQAFDNNLLLSIVFVMCLKFLIKSGIEVSYFS